MAIAGGDWPLWKRSQSADADARVSDGVDLLWRFLAESGSSTSRFIGSQVLTVCFRVSWGLSAKQRAILQLVSNGYRLIVIRSSLTSQIVRIALVEPQHGRTEYQIPLWRAQKLLEKGVVRTDTGSLDSASELQL